jgi:hypothetical protein
MPVRHQPIQRLGLLRQFLVVPSTTIMMNWLNQPENSYLFSTDSAEAFDVSPQHAELGGELATVHATAPVSLSICETIRSQHHKGRISTQMK